MKIAAIIWTFNPQISLLSKVIKSIIKQVDCIIIVDNCSKNYKLIKKSLKNYSPKINFIQIGYNSGVHAINVGIKYALKRGAQYILILDQDTIIVRKDAIPLSLKLFKKLSKRVAVIHLESKENSYTIKEIDHYIIFSGSIIKADVFRIHKDISVREDFFLDQADFDLFWQIRKKGYKIFSIGKKMISHELGKPFNKPFIFLVKPKVYEPSWRYYYIVRNSTLLLKERKMSFRVYIKQLILFLINIVFNTPDICRRI